MYGLRKVSIFNWFQFQQTLISQTKCTVEAPKVAQL